MTPQSSLGMRILGVLAIAIAGFLLVHYFIFGVSILRMPYPVMEYEVSEIVMVQFLRDGLNPYAIESQPQCTNLYGIGLPVLALPFTWLGLSPAAALRAVTSMSFIITAMLVGAWMKRLRVGPWTIAVALATFTALMLRDFTLTTTPNAVGHAFGVGALYVAMRSRFSPRGLALAIVLTACATLCKLYFLAVIYMIGLYVFLQISKRRGLATVGAATVTFFCLYWVVDWLMPAYWLCTVKMVELGAAQQRDIRHVLTYGVGYAKSTVAILPLACLFLVDAKLRGRLRIGLRHWSLLAPSAPLLRSTWIRYTGVIIGSGLIVLFGKLAYNNGAALLYYNHFLTPSLVIAGAWIFSRLRHPWLRAGAVLAVTVNLLFLAKVRYAPHHADSAGWQRAEELIANSDHVATGALLESLAYAHQKPIFASTMSDYTMRYLQVYPDRHPELTASSEATIGGMITKIKAREYDRLLFGGWLMAWPGVAEAVAANYEAVETLELHCPIGGQVWGSAAYFKYTVFAPRPASQSLPPDDIPATPAQPVHDTP